MIAFGLVTCGLEIFCGNFYRVTVLGNVRFFWATVSSLVLTLTETFPTLLAFHGCPQDSVAWPTEIVTWT